VGVGGVLIAQDAEVDGGADVVFVKGFDLFFEEAEIFCETGMACGVIGVVVEVAVVALGEEGDGVDMGVDEGLGERVGIEGDADVVDSGAVVEVEVDLP
jgi:hypothetical protein